MEAYQLRIDAISVIYPQYKPNEREQKESARSGKSSPSVGWSSVLAGDDDRIIEEDGKCLQLHANRKEILLVPLSDDDAPAVITWKAGCRGKFNSSVK